MTKTNSFSKQLTVSTENDRYLLQGKDGYYTNGLLINYSKVHVAKNINSLKQVDQYEIGQKMYTPYSRKILMPSQIDRPITGYLYAKFTRSNFVQHNQLWQWGASVGAIGKASLGEAVQNTFHRLIHVDSDKWGWIWNYQLNSEVGLNLHGSYARGLLQNKPSHLQITPVTRATLGTIFTNLSQGVLFQLGKFNSLHQNAYWNASVEDKNESTPSELFFYYYPELMYQAYNATVQGGLLRKDKGPITAAIEPFIFTNQFGGVYAWNRYTIKLEVTFQSREASSQDFTHWYSGMHGSYRFH